MESVFLQQSILMVAVSLWKTVKKKKKKVKSAIAVVNTSWLT